MTLQIKLFFMEGAWGQALAIALSNCNTKSSILVSDKKEWSL